jgi:hypothetical protein
MQDIYPTQNGDGLLDDLAGAVGPRDIDHRHVRSAAGFEDHRLGFLHGRVVAIDEKNVRTLLSEKKCGRATVTHRRSEGLPCPHDDGGLTRKAPFRSHIRTSYPPWASFKLIIA